MPQQFPIDDSCDFTDVLHVNIYVPNLGVMTIISHQVSTSKNFNHGERSPESKVHSTGLYIVAVVDVVAGNGGSDGLGGISVVVVVVVIVVGIVVDIVVVIVVVGGYITPRWWCYCRYCRSWFWFFD